jgi:acyl-CoA synthetase (AMP-forming)/AMP-acid ligase II
MPNIAMLLDLAADTMGSRIAVGDRDKGMTYEELRRLARSAAPEIVSRSKGTVAFVGENGPAVPVALFGSAWAGASFAPLNYRLPLAQQRSLAERIDTGLVINAVGSDEWLERMSHCAAPATECVSEPERPAVILFTSGTSSDPKAAILEHEHLLAYIFSSADFMSAADDEAVLLAVPPFHIAGVAGTLSAIYTGRRIVPLARFTSEAWLATARREEVTHAFVVPTMLMRLVAALDAEDGGDLPALRSLSYGGARMPVPVLERALSMFPNVDFVNAYGLTETSSTVALLGPEDHRIALHSHPRRLSSVGRPLPGIEVDVVDSDGHRLGANQPGRIRIRGSQVSGAYLGSESRVDLEGWLLTGDLGSVDQDGFLYIDGRADDVIIVGGENISPAEIEDCLLRHPKVTGAAVVGLPDQEWGEQVVAMVTTSGGVEPHALIEWVRQDLGGLKTPKRLEIREELPMTPTGKVLRRAIRGALAAE